MERESGIRLGGAERWTDCPGGEAPDGVLRSLPLDGIPGGRAELFREGLYLRTEVRCPARTGLWAAWLIGDAGTVRLGVLEPADGPPPRFGELSGRGGELRLSRRMSLRSLEPMGRPRRCEVRPVSRSADTPDIPNEGTPVPPPEVYPREGGGTVLSFPRTGPFPIPELFCFARAVGDGAEARWLFSFDENGRPVF